MADKYSDYSAYTFDDIELNKLALQQAANGRIPLLHDGDKFMIIGDVFEVAKKAEDSSKGKIKVTFKSTDGEFSKFAASFDMRVVDLVSKLAGVKDAKLNAGLFAEYVPVDIADIDIYNANAEHIEIDSAKKFNDVFSVGERFEPVWLISHVKNKKKGVTVRYKIVQLEHIPKAGIPLDDSSDDSDSSDSSLDI